MSIDKKYDGCHNCQNRMFDFCEVTMEHVDMYFQETCGESMCDFDHWEKED